MIASSTSGVRGSFRISSELSLPRRSFIPVDLPAKSGAPSDTAFRQTGSSWRNVSVIT
jgi:hypothetical protein